MYLKHGIFRVLTKGSTLPLNATPFFFRPEQGWATGLDTVAEGVQLAFTHTGTRLELVLELLNILFSWGKQIAFENR